ncbi:MAG: hypothetical protein IPP03_05140 [Dechloromonas sp.]|nr:hypothetical protein [Candidatus Dechloromonas phosphoritropha]
MYRTDVALTATPVSELANLASNSLFQVKNDAAELLTVSKALVEHIDRALDLKYVDRAHQLRLAAHKDTGVVHFDDGNVRVTADLPKKVEWDQKLLAELIARIAAAGDNPAEFIETSYRVSETNYQAWQESLRSQFTPARTVKVGKASYRLALLSE